MNAFYEEVQRRVIAIVTQRLKYSRLTKAEADAELEGMDLLDLSELNNDCTDLMTINREPIGYVFDHTLFLKRIDDQLYLQWAPNIGFELVSDSSLFPELDLTDPEIQPEFPDRLYDHCQDLTHKERFVTYTDCLFLPEKPQNRQIVINVSNGIIQDILTNDKTVKTFLVNFDDNDDEILSAKMVDILADPSFLDSPRLSVLEDPIEIKEPIETLPVTCSICGLNEEIPTDTFNDWMPEVLFNETAIGPVCPRCQAFCDQDENGDVEVKLHLIDWTVAVAFQELLKERFQ